METKIKDILAYNIEKSDYFKQRLNDLTSKMAFCQIHKFEEEERITRIKFQELLDVAMKYSNFVSDIKDFLSERKS